MAAPSTKFVLVVLCIFGLGVYDFLKNFEDNHCEMTYMFQWPEYMEVPLNKEVTSKFPKYGLYLYGEGSYAAKVRSFELTGIPVLFLPGNAASHKQVRSLGSVALRKTIDTQGDVFFNYFSIDFNEELSGLFGGVLQEQTEFVHLCLKHILTLYKTAKPKPKHVVLVGHSMGGMLARALFTLPDFNSDMVQLIITQATPHQEPVISLDPYLSSFCSKVNRYWQDHVNDTLKNVIVISTGGGYRDIQVKNGLTTLKNIYPEERSINTMTMSVPKSWASTDHQCAVWCKQMVMVTKRAMFDLVDNQTKQISDDNSHRMEVFHHYFEHNQGTKKYQKSWSQTVKLNEKIKWEMKEKRTWNFVRKTVKKTRYLVVKLPADVSFVAVSNGELDDWVAACEKENCKEASNLSPLADVIPPLYSNKKKIHLTPRELSGYSYIILIVPPSDKYVEVTAELYSEQRSLIYEAPGFLKWMSSFPKNLMQHDVFLPKTEEKAFFYNISLSSLSTVGQAYHAKLVPLNCTDTDSSNFKGSLMTLNIPWSKENVYNHIRVGQIGNMSLKLQTPKPENFSSNAELHLYLNPACVYQLQIKVSPQEMLGQFVRFYFTYLPVFVVVNILMALAYQLKCLSTPGGECPGFLDALGSYSQPWRVLIVAYLVQYIMDQPPIQAELFSLGVPESDFTAAAQKAISWSRIKAPILYIICTALVTLHARIIGVGTTVIAVVLGKICNCIFSRGNLVSSLGLLKYPILIVASLCSYIYCGSIGFLAVYSVIFIKVLYLKIKWRREKMTNQHSIYFTFLLLWMIIYVLNAPPLIVWIKNMSYSPYLTQDHSRIPSLIATLCLLVMETRNPNLNREIYHWVSYFLYISCVFMTLFSMVAVYRITYFVLAVTTILMAATFMPVAKEQVKEKSN